MKKDSSSLYAPGGLKLREPEACLQPASGGNSAQGIPVESSCPSNWIGSFLDCWSCKVTRTYSSSYVWLESNLSGGFLRDGSVVASCLG